MKTIPLLDTTIAGSIDEMASDVWLQLMDKMKVAEMFLLQPGESKDLSKDAQLPALVHFKETKTSWRDGDSQVIFPTSLSADGESRELLPQA